MVGHMPAHCGNPNMKKVNAINSSPIRIVKSYLLCNVNNNHAKHTIVVRQTLSGDTGEVIVPSMKRLCQDKPEYM